MQTFNITQWIMDKNDCYKAGKKITPKGIMVHSVGSKGTTFERWKKWNASGISKCVHFFIDGAGIYQTLPNKWRGWHAGGSANNTHIGFEICEPQTDTPENRDDLYAKTLFLCVHLCKLYGLTARDIITHCEGNKQGIASNHADVNHWWGKGVWAGYTMDRLRADVQKELDGAMDVPAKEESTGSSAAVAYTVKKGDTLSKIAKVHGTTYKELAKLNGIPAPYIIRVGQVLTIPGKDEWIVSRLLKKGVSGDDVKELQIRLNSAIYPGCGAVDGIFGSKTDSAVRAFQSSKKLIVDGIAGKNTISALGGKWED